MFGNKRLEQENLTLRTQVMRYKLALNDLTDKWNDLVEKINQRGGKAFLEGRSNQFSPAEIKDLITLCHPDKHQGSQKANDLTRKLLTLR